MNWLQSQKVKISAWQPITISQNKTTILDTNYFACSLDYEICERKLEEKWSNQEVNLNFSGFCHQARTVWMLNALNALYQFLSWNPSFECTSCYSDFKLYHWKKLPRSFSFLMVKSSSKSSLSSSSAWFICNWRLLDRLWHKAPLLTLPSRNPPSQVNDDDDD